MKRIMIGLSDEALRLLDAEIAKRRKAARGRRVSRGEVLEEVFIASLKPAPSRPAPPAPSGDDDTLEL